MNNTDIRKKVTTLFFILLGNLIYAFAITLFILPSRVMSSGTTGIALILQQYFGIDIPGFTMFFNVLMLAVGLLILGKRFVVNSVLCSLIYPVMLKGTMLLVGDYVLTDNLLLNVLFGGMGIGLSLGMVIRVGASTGGMDIPPLVLDHYFKIPVSVSLWCFDFVIILAQLAFHPAEDLLYGVILLLATSITMNRVLLAGTSRTEVKIISPKAGEIAQMILTQVDRGVTMLHGEGGYLHESTEIVLSVISNYELPRVEQLARRVDPDCFVIVSRVTEVWGRGFTGKKRYMV